MPKKMHSASLWTQQRKRDVPHGQDNSIGTRGTTRPWDHRPQQSETQSSQQCVAAAKKANKMLGIIKRNIESRPPFIISRLYKQLIRPHLEYSTVSKLGAPAATKGHPTLGSCPKENY
jgi:hypothetical protein